MIRKDCYEELKCFEGYLNKLKSNSHVFGKTNRRYFILDLNKNTFGYKTKKTSEEFVVEYETFLISDFKEIISKSDNDDNNNNKSKDKFKMQVTIADKNCVLFCEDKESYDMWCYGFKKILGRLNLNNNEEEDNNKSKSNEEVLKIDFQEAIKNKAVINKQTLFQICTIEVCTYSGNNIVQEERNINSNSYSSCNNSVNNDNDDSNINQSNEHDKENQSVINENKILNNTWNNNNKDNKCEIESVISYEYKSVTREQRSSRNSKNNNKLTINNRLFLTTREKDISHQSKCNNSNHKSIYSNNNKKNNTNDYTSTKVKQLKLGKKSLTSLNSNIIHNIEHITKYLEQQPLIQTNFDNISINSTDNNNNISSTNFHLPNQPHTQRDNISSPTIPFINLNTLKHECNSEININPNTKAKLRKNIHRKTSPLIKLNKFIIPKETTPKNLNENTNDHITKRSNKRRNSQESHFTKSKDEFSLKYNENDLYDFNFYNKKSQIIPINQLNTIQNSLIKSSITINNDYLDIQNSTNTKQHSNTTIDELNNIPFNKDSTLTVEYKKEITKNDLQKMVVLINPLLIKKTISNNN